MSNPLQILSNVAIDFTNTLRSRVTGIDYISIKLPPQLTPLPEPRNFIEKQILGEGAPSLAELEAIFKRIGNDPRPIGVILHLRGFQMSLADLQSLRDAILRLRETGKRVISYAHEYDLSTYYVASACDEILLQPGGVVATTGMYRQMVFLRDGLDAVGIQVDSVAITPYKGAADQLTLNEPSPEGREQTNWLLDSMFDTVVEDIASVRKMTPDAVKAMIDTALHTHEEALEAGYVDAVLNEEGLSSHLGSSGIWLWEDADKAIYHIVPRVGDKYVVVLHLSGTIVDGESASPPPIAPPIPIPFIGNERMGDITVVQQIRNIMRDTQAAALVVYVDSPGGSAAASEAIASALAEVAKDRPVVVCMGSVAASGGYYISTPAQWIVAQASTITGSIGVIMAKAVNTELLKKLHFNPVDFARGENADIIAPTAPFSEEQRARLRASIENIYGQFVKRVADSRNMSVEAVDELSGGRVWTGKQAHENGLVDQIGGLKEAIAKARALANLPDDAPATLYQGKGKPLPAQLAESVNPAAWFTYMKENLDLLMNSRAQFLLPFEWRE